MQELNVALGGSLDQRVQDLPGRMDHSTPSDQKIPLVRTGKAHLVRIDGAGALAATLTAPSRGAARLAVNSLHNQAVQRLAPRLVAEAWAPDGTIEAVRVEGARGFALGVQWHPEYDWEKDADSRAIFEAFGRAAAQHAGAKLAAAAE
jgi:putative glutamine amidotransferase